MIEFLCPNGHKIRCQADQAGHAAKCPRCGVRFRVPDAEDLAAFETVDSETPGTQPELGEPAAADLPASEPSPAKKERQIEFLCPNGHRLHGPASLQGRPGECPDCGSRFRIPTYDDISADEEAEREISLGRANQPEGSGAKKSAAGTPPPTPAPTPTSAVATKPQPKPAEAVEHAPAGPASAIDLDMAGGGRSAVNLFAKLWAARPDGATVELRLRDGEKIAVDQFLPAVSQQTQGVFATKAADGTLTLLAVAWDAIACVAVPGLTELPKGFQK